MSAPSASPISRAELLTVRTVYSIGDIKLDIQDFASSVGVDENGELFAMDPRTSVAADVIVKELSKDTYQFDTMQFKPGDVVVDLGAHVGIVSLYLARKYPFLNIYAYEPSPENYRHLLINIRNNRASGVSAFNQAVTADKRSLNMIAYYECNSGGATGQLREMELPHRVNFEVNSTTLDAIFADQAIGRCKLLKVDIEGSEHEVLMNARCLDRIEFLVGEFHLNDHLSAQGYSIEGLYEHVTRIIPARNVRYTPCRMAE